MNDKLDKLDTKVANLHRGQHAKVFNARRHDRNLGGESVDQNTYNRKTIFSSFKGRNDPRHTWHGKKKWSLYLILMVTLRREM